MSTIVPLVIFTLLSFSVFFMSFEVGERLGVGVTLVLTIEFARLALAANLPLCGEWLYIEIIFFAHFLFSTFSLLESCVVLAIAYNDSEHFLPHWALSMLHFMQRRTRALRGLSHVPGKSGGWLDDFGVGLNIDSVSGVLIRRKLAALQQGQSKATHMIRNQAGGLADEVMRCSSSLFSTATGQATTEAASLTANAPPAAQGPTSAPPPSPPPSVPESAPDAEEDMSSEVSRLLVCFRCGIERSTRARPYTHVHVMSMSRARPLRLTQSPRNPPSPTRYGAPRSRHRYSSLRTSSSPWMWMVAAPSRSMR
jgi:hypothetical protein